MAWHGCWTEPVGLELQVITDSGDRGHEIDQQAISMEVGGVHTETLTFEFLILVI